MCAKGFLIELPAVPTRKEATSDADSYQCLKHALLRAGTCTSWLAHLDIHSVLPAGALQELITKWMLLEWSYSALQTPGLTDIGISP